MQYSNPLEEELLKVSSEVQQTGKPPDLDVQAQLAAAILEQQAGLVDALSLVAERMERINRRLEEVERELRSFKERHEEAKHVVRTKLEEVDEIPQEIREQAKARLGAALQKYAAYQKAEAVTNGMEELQRAKEDGFVDFDWEYETTWFRFGDVAFVVRPGSNRIPKKYWPEIERNIATRRRLEVQKSALSAERGIKKWDEVKSVVLGG